MSRRCRRTSPAQVARALAEDIGSGDVTAALIAAGRPGPCHA